MDSGYNVTRRTGLNVGATLLSMSLATAEALSPDGADAAALR